MDESKPAADAALAVPAPPELDAVQAQTAKGRTAKAQRLAAALRDNLKRRKVAARIDKPRN